MKVVALCPELTPTIVARNVTRYALSSVGVSPTYASSLNKLTLGNE